MKISLLEPLLVSEEKIRCLAEPLTDQGHEFTYYNTKTTDIEELKKRSKGQDVVIIANNIYPDEVIRDADKLKLISVAFTGIDHVGVDACREKGIEVRNSAGYSNETVAELVIGLTLGIMRNIVAADTAVRSGKTNTGLIGTEIAGKKVGIIGCGKIGFCTAKLFQAFGAEVIAYQRSEHPDAKKQGIRFTDLNTLLQESDIVSIHMPLTASTRGFFDAEKINAMKQGAILINCARGPIVDNVALADALNRGHLSAAGIDVFDMEPPIPEDYCLLQAQNVLLAPHIAFLSRESMVRRAETVFENVYAYVRGEEMNICRL